MTVRDVRCQAAIVRGHDLLLIRHREHESGHSYWLLPGGGREHGETEAECVRREVREETHLEVEVEGLILREESDPGRVYKRRHTYLCRYVKGEPSPGIEPELEAAAQYAIVETRWFDMRDVASWDPDVLDDEFTGPLVRRIRAELGY
ncbi:MAG: NUDIX hydrolase [Anaerolineales bacterium]|nr:NUDIX hydrolase [Anaerolineales bacterium]